MKSVIKLIVVFFLLFANAVVFAQDPLNPGGDPGPAAPINDYAIPMLVLGVVIGYNLLRKKRSLIKK
jgi:hypothetical protein